MKTIRNVSFKRTVHIRDNSTYEQKSRYIKYFDLQKYIEQGIDVFNPSVNIITFKDVLSKNINERNYYKAFRAMSPFISGASYTTAEEMIDRIYDIYERLGKQQLLDTFDLTFCELIINPFAFSFYYTHHTEFGTSAEWPSGIIFCLKDRLDKDAEYVWGNEPYYFYNDDSVVLCDNVEQVRDCIKLMFKKISSKEDFERFANVFDQFKIIASSYLKQHKQELFLNNFGQFSSEQLNSAQLDYIQNKNKQKIKYTAPTYEIVEKLPE